MRGRLILRGRKIERRADNQRIGPDLLSHFRLFDRLLRSRSEYACQNRHPRFHHVDDDLQRIISLLVGEQRTFARRPEHEKPMGSGSEMKFVESARGVSVEVAGIVQRSNDGWNDSVKTFGKCGCHKSISVSFWERISTDPSMASAQVSMRLSDEMFDVSFSHSLAAVLLEIEAESRLGSSHTV